MNGWFRLALGSVIGALVLVLAGKLPDLEAKRIHAREVRQPSGAYVQVVYMVPSDAPDRHLDTDGSIARSILAAQRWFASRSGGLQLKFRYEQGPQVLFLRSRRNRGEWLSLGRHALYGIEDELRSAGWDASKCVMGVYFDGPNSERCGDAASPDGSYTGRIGVLYLASGWPEHRPCRSIPLAGGEGYSGYWEFLFLHEMLHALGFVTDCAPHYATLSHVSDSPSDLMYSGPLVWEPDEIDHNRDDYFWHQNDGCPDLADSPYVVPIWHGLEQALLETSLGWQASPRW